MNDTAGPDEGRERLGTPEGLTIRVPAKLLEEIRNRSSDRGATIKETIARILTDGQRPGVKIAEAGRNCDTQALTELALDDVAASDLRTIAYMRLRCRPAEAFVRLAAEWLRKRKREDRARSLPQELPPELTGAEYAGGYRVRVRFADGTEAVLDLEDELHGPVFEPLRDRGKFEELRYDPEGGTIAWPAGADLAPEWLYREAKEAAGGKNA